MAKGGKKRIYLNGMNIMCSAKSRLRGMLYLRLEGLGRQGMEGRAMFAEETAENILEFNNIKMTDQKNPVHLPNPVDFRKTKNDSSGIILSYVIHRVISNLKGKTLKSNGEAGASPFLR